MCWDGVSADADHIDVVLGECDQMVPIRSHPAVGMFMEVSAEEKNDQVLVGQFVR